MRSDKISIIIPVYNAENYISDILEDLIHQTYDNIQIIVVDDGSTDKSLNIIKEFLQLDERICLISSDNRGPSSARNIGLKSADGEYIRFIDADDRVPVKSMENMIAPFLVDKEVDLSIGNYVCTEEKNFYTGDSTKIGKKTENEFARMFVKNVKSFYYGVPWNKLYKREIIEKNHIRFDEKLIWCEDFLFNIEYYKQCRYVYVVDVKEGVYEYFVRESGITSMLSEWEKKELKRIDELRLESVLQYFSKFDLQDFCKLEWKYTGLYYKLSKFAHKQSDKTLNERYQDFYGLLSNKDVYRYICFMKEDSNLAVWKLLKFAIEKKQYRTTFIIFVLKEYIAGYLNPKIPFLRKRIKSKIPKFL